MSIANNDGQAPKLYVFAYGSMMNPDSLRISLPQMDAKNMKLGWLDGYERSWTAIYNIGSHSENPPKIIPVAFLNVMAAAGKKLNGIIFPVSPQELAILDDREFGYTRIDVTDNVSPITDGRVYMFGQNVGGTLYLRAMVAANYLRVINDGVALWGTDFMEAFRLTTVPNPYPVLEGDYHFLEDRHNQATGRSKVIHP